MTDRWIRSYLLRVASASTLAWASALLIVRVVPESQDPPVAPKGYDVMGDVLIIGSVINPVAVTALAALVAWRRPQAWLCRGAVNRWVFGGALAVLNAVGVLVTNVVVGAVPQGFGGIAQALFWTVGISLVFFVPLWPMVAGLIVGPPPTTPSGRTEPARTGTDRR